MKLSALILLLVAGACSFKKNDLANQTQNGHEELYSEPDREIDDLKPGQKRIVITATNDIGGSLGTRALKIKDRHNKDALHIEVGGVDFLSSYLKILRQKYKSVLLVDSGDILPPEVEDYPAVQEFYSAMKYDALVPGLSDLSMRSASGVNPVKQFSENSSVPVLASNLYELKTAMGIDWKGTSAYQLREIDGVKVGIIGILPDDITTLTPFNNRVGLYVESMLQSTLHQARRLRSLGAQVIVVLTHQGLDCGNAIAESSKLPLSKVNFEPAKDGVCDLRSPLGAYLQRLPARLVDVVVAGRNHRKVANLINGVAVISSFEAGKSFSYAEVIVDEKTGRPEETVIHQPVMVCREFFKETNDCYTEDPSVNHRERIPARFLGVQVDRDEEVRTKFKKFFDDVSVGRLPVYEDILRKTNSDIVYKESSGNTHLVALELSGSELSRWLEESYNLEDTASWLPDPFRRSGETLRLMVNGEEISAAKTYRVLTDIESLQAKAPLHKLITSVKLRSFQDLNWQTLPSVDEVTVTAAGPAR